MDYSNYMYPSPSPSPEVDPAAVAAITSVIVSVLILFALISYAVTAFLLSRIFKKAGESEWAAWVPIYNMWKLLEIGNQQGFWSILSLIPIVNIVSAVFAYIAMYHIGKKLGKEDWFVLIAIFIPVVWLIWLAFDDSKWQSSQPHEPKTVKKIASSS